MGVWVTGIVVVGVAEINTNVFFDVNEDFFFFQAEDGIRDYKVTGVQTCALPICAGLRAFASSSFWSSPITSFTVDCAFSMVPPLPTRRTSRIFRLIVPSYFGRSSARDRKSVG